MLIWQMKIKHCSLSKRWCFSNLHPTLTFHLKPLLFWHSLGTITFYEDHVEKKHFFSQEPIFAFSNIYVFSQEFFLSIAIANCPHSQIAQYLLLSNISVQ